MPALKLSELMGALSHALDITADTVGTAIDADCFAHLKRIIQAHPEFFPR